MIMIQRQFPLHLFHQLVVTRRFLTQQSVTEQGPQLDPRTWFSISQVLLYSASRTDWFTHVQLVRQIIQLIQLVQLVSNTRDSLATSDKRQLV